MIEGAFLLRVALIVIGSQLIKQLKAPKEKKTYEIHWDISDVGVSYQYQFMRKDE